MNRFFRTAGNRLGRTSDLYTHNAETPGSRRDPTARAGAPSRGERFRYAGLARSGPSKEPGRGSNVERWRVSTAWKKACRVVKLRSGHRCEVCGTPETFRLSPTGRRMSNLVIGHKVPPERYAGTPFDLGNLFALCRPCNASQGNRTVDEWRAAQTGRLVELGIVGRTGRSRAVVVRDYTAGREVRGA